MFDISSVNYDPFVIDITRGLSNSSSSNWPKVESLSYKFYSQFISNGIEYIFVPKYKGYAPLDIASDFEMVLTGEEGLEPLCFYWRLSKNPDSVIQISDCPLAFMTLFLREKNDALNKFYDYYRKQGVGHFYMYYNGDLNDRKGLPKYDDVSYHEWNFPYVAFGCHHAQVPAINDFSKRYMHFHDWCIMADIDEFIFSPEGSLLNYFKNLSASNKNITPIWVPHFYAQIDHELNLIKTNPFDTSEFVRLRKTVYPGKWITPGKSINVHVCQHTHTLDMAKRLFLFHDKGYNLYKKTLFEISIDFHNRSIRNF